MKFIDNERGSFVADVFLLPFLAVIQVWLMTRYFFKCFDKRAVKIKLSVFVVSVFWSIALGLYCDFFSFQFLAPGMTGNDFMWNWPLLQIFGHRLVPLEFIPTYSWNVPDFLNVVALIFFLVVYPIMYYLGFSLGHILFGRSEKQEGGIDLVFPREIGDKDNFN